MKYTYEIHSKKVDSGSLIGIRKTAKSAAEFAELLISPKPHFPDNNPVVIFRRERKSDDFSY